MKRFRITILAICLILAWLGYKDTSLTLRNREPMQISIAELEEAAQVPREWLQVTGGFQDLLQGINMSGSMNIDSFLIPIKTEPTSTSMKVWFETRDPAIISALKTYYFVLNDDKQRERYVQENIQLFSGSKTLTGMTADSLVANSNRRKLVKLLKEMNIQTPEDAIFISEGKKPAQWRGFFFIAIAVIGIVKVFSSFARAEK